MIYGRGFVRIKNVCLSDIPVWISLSKEYDTYIRDIVSELTEWYEGGETSISFDSYMKAKIDKNEVFMVTDEDENCHGIIAVSKANHRITFFAVSHKSNFAKTGDYLLDHALSVLDKNAAITANILKSNADHIQKQYALFNEYGFVFSFDGLENGTPVSCMERNPKQ